MNPTVPEIVLYFICLFYAVFPLVIEQMNKWLWNRMFRRINYAVTIVLAAVFFVLPMPAYRQKGFFYSMLIAPFLFYSLYWLFDRAMLYMYERHFIIVGRGMSRYKWGFNNVDIFFTMVMLLVSLVLPPMVMIWMHSLQRS